MNERGNGSAQPPQGEGRGRGWRFYATLAVIALALIFVVQNNEETNVTFLFAETELPLFFALIIAIVLGALIGWLTPRVRRGGEREKQSAGE